MPWFLHSVRCNPAPRTLDQPGYGHTVPVEFLLHYRPPARSQPSRSPPKLFSSSRTSRTPAPPTLTEEPPDLVWSERFIMIDHTSRQRWEWATDMYQHNPASRTLLIWQRRYISAATGQGDLGHEGRAQLLDNQQQPVTMPTAAAQNADNAQKADWVRNYLAANGGYLEITIEDRPWLDRGIPESGPNRRERLLLAECGVTGSTRRLKWAQHIIQDKSLPPAHWQRQCQASWFMNSLPLPAGYTNVQPPAHVTAARPKTVGLGEYT